MQYTEPVSKLLNYGECSRLKDWPDYLTLGFSEKDIPQLIEMFRDKNLQFADSDSIEVWAPVHAWRTLAQLNAKEAIIPIIDYIEEFYDDWSGEELPYVLGMIGEDCIEPIKTFIFDPSKPEWPKVILSHGLEKVGNTIPSAKNKCIQIFTDFLNQATSETRELNGFIVSYLVDLSAKDSIEAISDVFNKNIVDIQVGGDLEDVEIELGLRISRSTPRPRYGLFNLYNPLQNDAKKKKIGRNETCPCGSGKKYKKCCLGKI